MSLKKGKRSSSFPSAKKATQRKTCGGSRKVKKHCNYQNWLMCQLLVAKVPALLGDIAWTGQERHFTLFFLSITSFARSPFKAVTMINISVREASQLK